MKKFLSFFPVLFFLLLSSCSNGTTSITLTLRSDDFSPSLARDIEPDSSIKEAGYYVVASIRGAYNQAQSSFLARNEDEGTFTFDNIPVGRKVYAEVKVYTLSRTFMTMRRVTIILSRRQAADRRKLQFHKEKTTLIWTFVHFPSTSRRIFPYLDQKPATHGR